MSIVSATSYSVSNDNSLPNKHLIEDKFKRSGDSISRSFWRYTILKDGTVHCINVASNGKKPTPPVLHIKIPPAESINNVPVTNYFSMFRNTWSLQHISFSSLNFSHVRTLGRMFSGCIALKSVDMSGLDLSNVTNYQHMFDDCRALKTVNFTGSDLSGAVNLDSMFYGCTSLTMIILNGLTGRSIKTMNHMFRSCSSLKILELPNISVNESVEMKKLFRGANNIAELICPSEVIRAKYLKDMYDDSSSSDTPSASPSIEVLNEQLTDSDNENPSDKYKRSSLMNSRIVSEENSYYI